MLNAEIIKRDKPEMDDANISAFIRLARNFDCLDCESYAEAHAKILMSMEDISNEMETTDGPEEQRAIMRRRYANLGERA